MANTLKALGKYVVAKPVEAKKKTSSGILLPESSTVEVVSAEVVSIGDKVEHVSVGDRVIYREYNVSRVSLGEVEYIVLEADNVMATVEEDS